MTQPTKLALAAPAILLIGSFLIFPGRPSTSPNLQPSRVPASPNARTSQLPKTIFWAWERPEDFRFLDNRPVGVAFLAKTLYLKNQSTASQNSRDPNFAIRPRRQPLRVSPATPLIAVVRIEAPTTRRRSDFLFTSSKSSVLFPYNPAQIENIAAEITQLHELPGVRAIQIDFDATASQQAFYADLLAAVRRQLPQSFPLSITALASWCAGDRWLDRLPPHTIDEAVPMLFRMGPASGDIVDLIYSGKEFPSPSCQTSMGLSTDETFSAVLLSEASSSRATSAKRIYIFAPRAWTPASANFILKELHP